MVRQQWLIGVVSMAGLVALIGAVQAQDGDRTEAPAKPDENRAGIRYAVRLQSDGTLRGRTSTIDPNTLQLVPVANSHVIFVQQGRIVSEAVSGPSGAFVATGLSPQAVYTVITKTPGTTRLYAAMSFAVLAPEKRMASTKKADLQFARFDTTTRKIRSVAELVLTLVPISDLGVVGLPDEDTGPAPAVPPAAAGGGGGGGGAGGLDGAGLFGALAVAAGVAAAVSNDDTASPFSP